MQKLLKLVKKLMRGKTKNLIDARLREFRTNGRKQNNELFKELCFCILTANFNAERAINIQEAIGNGFLTLSKQQLAGKLKELGYRFPNTRAGYIVEARKYLSQLKGKTREWLVENIKGLGWKEASHFLRNIGYENVAIIDFHILDILARHGLVKKPKTLTKKKYLAIEGKLRELGEKLGISLAELDLYLWFAETGKVLK